MNPFVSRNEILQLILLGEIVLFEGRAAFLLGQFHVRPRPVPEGGGGNQFGASIVVSFLKIDELILVNSAIVGSNSGVILDSSI